jgi:hypothetical protein
MHVCTWPVAICKAQKYKVRKVTATLNSLMFNAIGFDITNYSIKSRYRAWFSIQLD